MKKLMTLMLGMALAFGTDTGRLYPRRMAGPSALSVWYLLTMPASVEKLVGFTHTLTLHVDVTPTNIWLPTPSRGFRTHR